MLVCYWRLFTKGNQSQVRRAGHQIESFQTERRVGNWAYLVSKQWVRTDVCLHLGRLRTTTLAGFTTFILDEFLCLYYHFIDYRKNCHFSDCLGIR